MRSNGRSLRTYAALVQRMQPSCNGRSLRAMVGKLAAGGVRGTPSWRAGPVAEVPDAQRLDRVCGPDGRPRCEGDAGRLEGGRRLRPRRPSASPPAGAPPFCTHACASEPHALHQAAVHTGCLGFTCSNKWIKPFIRQTSCTQSGKYAFDFDPSTCFACHDACKLGCKPYLAAG